MSLEVLGKQPSWQEELLASYTSAEDLHRAGLIGFDEAAKLTGVGERYQIRVPRYYASLIQNTPNCPIRKQALPALAEDDPELPEWAQEWSKPAFGRETPWTQDAIGDVAKLAAPRLTHRYENRAILHLSSLCALYCRFCFRKSHLNDDEKTLYNGSLEPALDYLRAHTEIRELILTGGDPLSLPDSWLEKFFEKLAIFSHLRHVRIHSRMAVTLPSRLTPALAGLCANASFSVSLVSHFNHPVELTPFAREQPTRFRKRGVTLYNQSVLLKDVNDDAETLSELFQELYELGVRPFYLHHPDWTPGTFHFRVSIKRGRELARELAGKLSGPALPQYVLDSPNGVGKVSLLDESRVRLIETQIDASTGIGGSLYEVSPPRTRTRSSDRNLYAEFYFRD